SRATRPTTPLPHASELGFCTTLHHRAVQPRPSQTAPPYARLEAPSPAKLSTNRAQHLRRACLRPQQLRRSPLHSFQPPRARNNHHCSAPFSGGLVPTSSSRPSWFQPLHASLLTSTTVHLGPTTIACLPKLELVPLRDQAFSVSQFRGYHPATFNGQGDPRLVDEWLRSLDMIFEVMDCPEPHRIMCAQLQMIGDAGLWWHSYWEMRPGEKLALTWAGLKALLREKYYPAHYRERMERQFLALEQGSRTVDEYERDFTRLGFF
ncbi:Unknown protein, partial [Striga hermonthica]